MPTVDGLISGLDTTSIVEQMMNINRIPIRQLQSKIDLKSGQLDSLQLFTSELLNLKFKAFDLTKASTYRQNDVSSSNAAILSATGIPSDSTGSFDFRVARLAASAQAVSDGMADRDTSTLAAGTITFEMGGGFIDKVSDLSELNGGVGFTRGSISVTDGAGNNKKIDLSLAVNVQDVLDDINETSGLQVAATLAGDSIVLSDTSGGGTVTVTEVDGGQTANSLGLLKAHSAGVITGNDVNTISLSTDLDLLNDGNGVRILPTGQDDLSFTLIDVAQNFTVDLGGSETIGDVINAINAASGGNLTASLDVEGKNLRLVDNTSVPPPLPPPPPPPPISLFAVTALTGADGRTSGALVDLGLEGVLVESAATGAVLNTGTVISGERLVGTLNSNLLRNLNGGRQANGSGGGVIDGSISVTDKAGANAIINLNSRVSATVAGAPLATDTSITVAPVAAAGFEVGNSFRLSDGTNNIYRTITAVNRGTGLISFADALGVNFAAGPTAYASNESTGDVINAISNHSSVNVTASFSSERHGFAITDNTGSTGNLTVAESGASTAAQLGLLSAALGLSKINGTDRNTKYISENTKLADFNNGDGVFQGSFLVTDRNNKTFQVNVPNAVTVEDVIFQFNAAASTATSDARLSVNAAGNGLLLSSPTGAGAIVVQDVNGGTTSRDLNISGNVVAASIDGSFQYSVTLTGTETLNDLKDKINNLNLDLRATIIDDGSSINPFRLNLVSNVSGSVGRLLVDDIADTFNFATTTKAQDSAVLFGGTSSGSTALLVTDNDNVVSNLVPGLTLNLKKASSETVTVNITRNTEKIVETIDEFIEGFNNTIEEIHFLSDYDLDDEFSLDEDEDPRKSILRGNYAMRRVESELFKVANSTVQEITSSFKRLSSIGIKVGADGLSLSFDKSKLTAALNDDYDDVVRLLDKGGAITNTTAISSLRGGSGLRGVTGNDIRITLRDNTQFEINLSGAKSIADVVTAINFHSSNPGTMTAKIRDDGSGLILTDSTVGASDFVIQNINSSLAGSDLGITQAGLTSGTDKEIKGFSLENRGIFSVFNAALSRIVDSGGVLDGQSNTFEDLIDDYNERIDQIESRVQGEQERLFAQFANLENVLAGLQSQSSFLSVLFPR